MNLKELNELDERNKVISHSLRLACDKLNDAIAECSRNGLAVNVEVVEDERPIVVVRPMFITYY